MIGNEFINMTKNQSHLIILRKKKSVKFFSVKYIMLHNSFAYNISGILRFSKINLDISQGSNTL